jgi:hypothetical protein
VKRRAFLAGLAAIAVSSKLPPLPAPAAPAVLPALPAKIPGVVTAPGGWCAPSEVVYELARVELHGEGGLYGTFHRSGGPVIDVRDELPIIRVRRSGIKFAEAP